MAGELGYLDRPGAAGFERPYGWAWALALHGEAARHEAGWGAALLPLARAFAVRFEDHLPKLTYPIRVGTHFNTAFALTLAGLPFPLTTFADAFESAPQPAPQPAPLPPTPPPTVTLVERYDVSVRREAGKTKLCFKPGSQRKM